MKPRFLIVACGALVFTFIAFAFPRPVPLSAEPHLQSAATPTEEPTKRPYVFPTPIFIPTYADDTPVPRRTPAATRVPGQAGDQTYTVEPGDSLWVIAQKMYNDGTKYKLIMEANGITDQTRLRVGTVLQIPSLGGNPAPTIAPPSSSAVPTIAPSPDQPFVLATAVPLPTAVPGENTTSTSIPFIDILPTVINLVSAFFVIAAIVSGVLAYRLYLRTRKIKELGSGKQSIRLKR